MRNQILYTLLCICLLSVSCTKEFFSGCVDGNDAEDTKLIELPEVTKIIIGFSAKTTIEEGPVQKIEITGPQALIEKIISDSNYDDKEYEMKIIGCSTISDVEVNFVITELEELSVSGNSDVKFINKFNNIDDLKFDASGFSSMDINIGAANKVDISSSGNSDIKIEGTANDFKNDISGDCQVSAFDFFTQTCDIDISGFAKMEVQVEKELKVNISGDGEVCYKGTPIIDINLSGGGELKNCN